MFFWQPHSNLFLWEKIKSTSLTAEAESLLSERALSTSHRDSSFVEDFLMICVVSFAFLDLDFWFPVPTSHLGQSTWKHKCNTLIFGPNNSFKMGTHSIMRLPQGERKGSFSAGMSSLHSLSRSERHWWEPPVDSTGRALPGCPLLWEPAQRGYPAQEYAPRAASTKDLNSKLNHLWTIYRLNLKYISPGVLPLH